MTEKKS